VDQVPDLRALGTRLVHGTLAFVLGQATAWEVAYLIPHRIGQLHASLFAPLFLIIAIGCGLGLVWYLVFDAIRRAGMDRVHRVPAAVAVRLARPAPARSWPRPR